MRLLTLAGSSSKKALDVVAAVGIVLQFIQQLHLGGASADDGHRHRSRLLPLDADGSVHPVAEPTASISSTHKLAMAASRTKEMVSWSKARLKIS